MSSNQRRLWERTKVLVAGVLMQIASFPHRQGQQRPKTEAGKPMVARRGHKAWWGSEKGVGKGPLRRQNLQRVAKNTPWTPECSLQPLHSLLWLGLGSGCLSIPSWKQNHVVCVFCVLNNAYSICMDHLISLRHGLQEDKQPLSPCHLKSPEGN